MITVGILTISDAVSKGQRQDISGANIQRIVAKIGGQTIKRDVVPDERELIAGKLAEWADGGQLELVITTGGTGLSPRDVTPEATLQVLERVVPGLPEAMRARTGEKNIHAMLSRGVAGIRARCLIINLPGNPAGVEESLEAVLPAIPHAIDIMKGLTPSHTPPEHHRHEHHS